MGKRISGCSWSPDLQHLVIASENQLFIVSRIQQDGHQFFKILAETILRPTSLGKGYIRINVMQIFFHQINWLQLDGAPQRLNSKDRWENKIERKRIQTKFRFQ